MSAKIKIYGIEVSPPVRAVLMTLEALKLDYELKELSPLKGQHLTPEYLKMNPQHTVPTLEDNGKFIWDSHAICAFLVRKYGKDDSLYPKDFYQRAVVDQRLHYENGNVFTNLGRLVRPLLQGTASDETTLAAKRTVEETFEMLETFLDGEFYFAGSHLTIADLSLVTSVTTAAILVPIESNKLPKLTAWLERMKQLPYYKINEDGLELNKEYLKSQMQ